MTHIKTNDPAEMLAIVQRIRITPEISQPAARRRYNTAQDYTYYLHKPWIGASLNQMIAATDARNRIADEWLQWIDAN